MNKTAATWESTRMWCMANPAKRAAIVTPDGTFTLVFMRNPVPPTDLESIEFRSANTAHAIRRRYEDK